MKTHPANLWIIVTVACLLSIDPGEAWSQQTRKQRQKQQQQQQLLQRAIQQSAGPAGAFTPNIGTDQPMKGALWGQGGELQNAMREAERQIKAQTESGKAISAEQLAQALPPAIGEYSQTELVMPPPAQESGTATWQSVATTVSATYLSPAKQTLVVRLTDIGIMQDLAPKGDQEKTENAPQSVDTGEAVFQVKQIEGIEAKIYYDRIKESGNLMMNANRVSVSIDGQNIPFAMLEMSAAELKVKDLAKLGG